MKGVPIDESLCAYLKKYHKGQCSATRFLRNSDRIIEKK